MPRVVFDSDDDEGLSDAGPKGLEDVPKNEEAGTMGLNTSRQPSSGDRVSNERMQRTGSTGTFRRASNLSNIAYIKLFP